MGKSPEDLKRRLMIQFDGEDGLDYGGVSRFVYSTTPSYPYITDAIAENSSSSCHTRCSIQSIASSNILPTIIIPSKSTQHPGSTRNISAISDS